MLVPGKPIQSSLMFAGKAKACLSGATHRQALAFPSDIRLGWKGLPGTNSLAYYERSYLTAVKSFITLRPGPNVIKLFMSVIYGFS